MEEIITKISETSIHTWSYQWNERISWWNCTVQSVEW